MNPSLTAKFVGDSRSRILLTALIEYLELGEEPKYKQRHIQRLHEVIKQRLWNDNLNLDFHWIVPTKSLVDKMSKLLTPKLNVLFISSLLHDVHFESREELRSNFGDILSNYRESIWSIINFVS